MKTREELVQVFIEARIRLLEKTHNKKNEKAISELKMVQVIAGKELLNEGDVIQALAS